MGKVIAIVLLALVVAGCTDEFTCTVDSLGGIDSRRGILTWDAEISWWTDDDDCPPGTAAHVANEMTAGCARSLWEVNGCSAAFELDCYSFVAKNGEWKQLSSGTVAGEARIEFKSGSRYYDCIMHFDFTDIPPERIPGT